jgi:hypothetical protein
MAGSLSVTKVAVVDSGEVGRSAVYSRVETFLTICLQQLHYISLTDTMMDGPHVTITKYKAFGSFTQRS